MYQLYFFLLSLSLTAGKECQDKCGNLSIPYPFGTTEGCYLNKDFLIACNSSNNTPFLGETDIEVLGISIQGQLRVSTSPAYDCYDEYGNTTIYTSSGLITSKFPVSDTQNKLTAIGCDTNVIIRGWRTKGYATGCVSYCEKIEDVVNGTCSGMGCCQSSIPGQVLDFLIDIDSFFQHKDVWKFNPCSYAFLVEVNAYNFSTLDYGDLSMAKKFPVVLDWAIGNETCNDAVKNPETFACKDSNSFCYDSDNGPGYRCNCSVGYKGNPYLANGCIDIDECEIQSLNQCTDICENIVGNYTCSCPKGSYGDGRNDGSGCILYPPSGFTQTWTVIGVSLGFVLVFLAVSLIFLGIQRRSLAKIRRGYFKQNGGFLLQQLLFKSKHSANVAKIFSEKELNNATNNFSKSMVIGQGGYGVVYKGILSDNRIVAIKRSKAIDRTQIEQFVNEVIILSQIHHPNAVKLLGCCLETPVPLLVYDFITNGTLFYHLHGAGCINSLTWETRLRIAEETATALAYMHSMQIIHRDVKSANILLDDEFIVKVSDFGVSRLVSLDQEEQVTTLVQGTIGYIDPEYFQSGILTEKSDVYSFGVVLAELLTGKKAICSECEEKSLALYFISSLKKGCLLEILEDREKEGNAKQVEKVAEIARNCLRLEGDKRPTMKEVLEELAILRKFGFQTDQDYESFMW